MPSGIAIRRYTARPQTHALERALDAIFFEASNTKSFPNEADRAVFRYRWLGRYLEHWPELAHVACDGDGRPVGYIVGAHVDPAKSRIFEDIAYFDGFRELTARFPAHLHVNLAPEARGMGIGGRLVAAFLDDAMVAGVPGVHVVTGRRARNIGFYARNGFLEAGTTGDGARDVVFLARAL